MYLSFEPNFFRSFHQLTRNQQNRAFPNLWSTLYVNHLESYTNYLDCLRFFPCPLLSFFCPLLQEIRQFIHSNLSCKLLSFSSTWKLHLNCIANHLANSCHSPQLRSNSPLPKSYISISGSKLTSMWLNWTILLFPNTLMKERCWWSNEMRCSKRCVFLTSAKAKWWVFHAFFKVFIFQNVFKWL